MTWTIYINLFPPSQGGSTLNLALIGQAVSDEKMFEIVDNDHEDHNDHGCQTIGIL